MSQDIYKTPSSWSQFSHISSIQNYKNLYETSVTEPEKFWDIVAQRLLWNKKWHTVKHSSFNPPVHIEWFIGGELNVSENCIDRHLTSKSNQTAIIWEPDHPDEKSKLISYQELYDEVISWALILKSLGIKKGDHVVIYMPMIPEAAYAMLACTRIGAVHCVVFGGFSSDALKDRIQDSEAHFIITADGAFRAQKLIPLKQNIDEALHGLTTVEKVLIVQRTMSKINLIPERDVLFETERQKLKAPENSKLICPPEVMQAEDPLFILYTSGSTNKPKGVLHTTGGYLVYTSYTHEMIFDYNPGQVYWCTADIGWITGHSYLLYGPLANGATTLMYEGVPNYPNPSRVWEIIDKHKVNIFYTAPTAIRALMKEGDEWVKKTDRSSLTLLGSVGEPINPAAWEWYFHTIGKGQCPIVDTWWQTETGGIMISPLPGAIPQKPGSATLPFFGIKPLIINEKGEILSGPGEGYLCLADSWPGQMRTVYKNHSRFEETYFALYPGNYFTGDGCRRDEDGYYWITGRVDDVLNVSGHRIGTAEVESALVAHFAIAEAAVVGGPHDIKGQGIYAFVILKKKESEASLELSQSQLLADLKDTVRHKIGGLAVPDHFYVVRDLPKTRSGKIMRRILRKLTEGELNNLGDTSTLADPSIVEELKNFLKDKKMIL